MHGLATRIGPDSHQWHPMTGERSVVGGFRQTADRRPVEIDGATDIATSTPGQSQHDPPLPPASLLRMPHIMAIDGPRH